MNRNIQNKLLMFFFNPMNDDVISLDRCFFVCCLSFFKWKADVFCPVCLSDWHPWEDQRGAGWNCEGRPGSSAAASIQAGFHQCVAAEGNHRRRDEGSSFHPGRRQCYDFQYVLGVHKKVFSLSLNILLLIGRPHRDQNKISTKANISFCWQGCQ